MCSKRFAISMVLAAFWPCAFGLQSVAQTEGIP